MTDESVIRELTQTAEAMGAVAEDEDRFRATVDAFLAGTLPFLGISEVVERVLEELPAKPVVDVQTLVERDGEARRAARGVLHRAYC